MPDSYDTNQHLFWTQLIQGQILDLEGFALVESLPPDFQSYAPSSIYHKLQLTLSDRRRTAGIPARI